MHCDGDHDVDFAFVVFVVVGVREQFRECVQFLLLLHVLDFHAFFVAAFHLVKRVFHTPRPPGDFRSNYTHSKVLFEPVMAVHFGLPVDALFRQFLERVNHFLFNVVEPILHFALRFDIGFEFEFLVLGRDHALDEGGRGEHKLFAVVEQLTIREVLHDFRVLRTQNA